MNKSPRLPEIAAIVPNLYQLAQSCDHIDVKTYTGHGRMDQFLSGFLSYMPAWVKGLYGVRAVFVRLLGMRQQSIASAAFQLAPTQIPMQAGANANVFIVQAAAPESYWLASATDKHLTAYLCVIATPEKENSRQFHVITLVQYHHWTGPVYFNTIRPFHHVVVDQMARAGLAASRI